MRRIALIILILGLTVLPGLLIQPVLVLRVTSGDGAAVLCRRAVPGTVVTLEFTHSMYGGSVRETYRMDSSGDLTREQILTERAAAAEYYATDGQTRRTPGGYEVLVPPYRTHELVIRADARGDHQLTIGDARYRLMDLLPGSTQVRISAGQRTWAGLGTSC